MSRKIPAFAISALVTLALPFTVLAQKKATDSPAVVSDGGSAPAKQAPTPNTFGTTAVSYVEVQASSFLPWTSSATFTSDNYGHGPRWVTNAYSDLSAPLHLPAGAKITYLELDFQDTSASHVTYGSLFVCNYHATGCVQHPVTGAGPGDCVLGGFICSGLAYAGGNSYQWTDLTSDNITVDNYNYSYSLLAEPNATDGTEKVGGMIVGYVLQVSPAPLTATFTDVPTSYWAFQYIEALRASGITTGITPTTYQPESTVTRAQMAAFLARALGLQFN